MVTLVKVQEASENLSFDLALSQYLKTYDYYQEKSFLFGKNYLLVQGIDRFAVYEESVVPSCLIEVYDLPKKVHFLSGKTIYFKANKGNRIPSTVTLKSENYMQTITFQLGEGRYVIKERRASY